MSGSYGPIGAPKGKGKGKGGPHDAQKGKQHEQQEQQWEKKSCPICHRSKSWVEQHIASTPWCRGRMYLLEDGLRQAVETLIAQREEGETTYNERYQHACPSCARKLETPDSLQQHRDAKGH